MGRQLQQMLAGMLSSPMLRVVPATKAEVNAAQEGNRLIHADDLLVVSPQVD